MFWIFLTTNGFGTTMNHANNQQQQRTTTATTSSMMRVGSSSFWALLSGTLGAAASCFAKLAFSSSSSQGTTILSSVSNNSSALSSSCPSLETWSSCFRTSTECAVQWLACHGATVLLPRAACLLAMIACNAAMVACLVGGLQDAGSIAGTALATAANFLASAAAGYWLWNEQQDEQQQNPLYGPGLVLVVAGTVLLVWAQRPEEEEQTTNETRGRRDKNVKGD